MITQPIGTTFQQSLIDNQRPAPQDTRQDELGKDDFLSLLVTQLKHQDPLSPMKSVEFTAQLAQFSSLEQLFGVNETLGNIQNSLASQEDGNLLDYIGKVVKTDDNRITLKDAHAEAGAYILDDRADVSVLISDEKGLVVRRIEEGWKGAGEHAFQWDGRNNGGTMLSDGIHTFTVQAKDENDSDVLNQTCTNGKVTGVTYENYAPYLIVGDKRVAPEDILAVAQPEESGI